MPLSCAVAPVDDIQVCHAFVCTTWHTLTGMKTTDDDKHHCLQAIVNAVKM
jgi:hypothetical protein